MEKKIEKTKVYNVIIMDRSGSMWDIRKPAIMGFNEVLGGVKAAQTKYAETQEQFITLVLFDSASIDEVYWNADPSKAEHLTTETYVPGSATPLYDAMGRTLTKLERELKGDENHSVLVTVITDGYENDSREYDLASVKALVEHLKDQGWTFAYMGTDHDVHAVSIDLSITNVVKFEKTAEETLETFKKERRARERWGDLQEGAPRPRTLGRGGKPLPAELPRRHAHGPHPLQQGARETLLQGGLTPPGIPIKKSLGKTPQGLLRNCRRMACQLTKKHYLCIGIVAGNSGRRDDNPLKVT